MTRSVALAAAAALSFIFAAPAAQAAWNNGKFLNGVSMQGVQVNGIQVNGQNLNGQSLNGQQLNGQNINGTTMQGVAVSGLRQPTDAARATVTTVVLPSGETIDLR